MCVSAHKHENNTTVFKQWSLFICVCIYFFYCVSVIVFLDNELLIQASEVILA